MVLISHKGKLDSRARGPRRMSFRRSADNPCFRCATLISNQENPQASGSEIWTWESRGVRTPQQVVMWMPSGM